MSKNDNPALGDAMPDGPMLPDPSSSELKLAAAARAYDKTALAIEQHEGARTGEAYEAKILAWRWAIKEIRDAAREYVKEHPSEQ